MWTIKRRFLCTFLFFALTLVIAMALVSGFYLHDSFVRIENAPDPSLIPLMANRMYSRFLVGFTLAVFITILISIPVGLSLFRVISKRYLNLLSEIRELGESRLALEGSCEELGEIQTLEQYRRILQDDLQKIQDYEKVQGWQSGARMLIHELKNPMTPLKLNAQKLALRGDESKELKRILTATEDMEIILRAFRDLVNIEFPAKATINIKNSLAEMCDEFCERYPQLIIEQDLSSSVVHVLSEQSLLKMIMINLINNSIEANPDICKISIVESEKYLDIEVLTQDRKLDNPSQIYRLGNSEKGEGRGFGLFLCREISNYLNLNLSASNEPEGVLFQLSLQKSEIL